MAVVGVDVSKGRWVAVVLREGQWPAAHVLARIDQVTDMVPDAEAIGIDIPIGLADSGHRLADLAARAVLGPRRSSVFLTPVRAALEASTHAAASAISVERCGSGISRQAFALKAKILEVDHWWGAAPCPVFEVHPEVAFAVMCARPATASKKSWHGMVERRAALEREGVRLDHVDPQVGAAVGVDDLLDAAAVAWSAGRARRGEARSFPDPPELDGAGRQIAIWA